MELNNIKKFKVGLFSGILIILLVVTLWIPMRPTYSLAEKRELKEFPNFTVTKLFSGSYFRDIDTWFADTFPSRDTLILINTKYRQLFGIRTKEIHGDVTIGDEIPDVPSMED